MNKNKMNQ